MAYRTPARVCSQCDRTHLIRDCARCGAAGCWAHVPAGDEWCTDCVAAYWSEVGRLRLRHWFWAGFASATPLAWVMIGPMQEEWRQRMWVWGAWATALAGMDAVAMTVIMGLLLGSALVAMRRWLHRRRFA